MNPANAKISVIIPNYNHGPYLAECIESALRQTLKPFEVIVVDDGSTDNTREVLSRYPVQSIFLHRQGPSGARNAGIQAASGDWIALLDADDYWLPEKLERQMAAIQDEGFCYCASTLFFKDGRKQAQPFYESSRIKAVLRDQNCIDISTIIIRKDKLLEVGGFNVNMPAAEDWEVWLKLSRVTKFLGVPEMLVMTRMTGTGLGADPEIVFRSMEGIVAAGTAGLPPVSRFIRARRMRSVRTALAAIKYRDRGDFDAALRYSWQAFAHWPSPFYGKAFRVLVFEIARKLRGKPQAAAK
jgi:glycosyltransferase involved in cell wall biosynthesis